MKIRALEVDGFGVWSGLKLDNLSEGLSVFFGPNEAGKTTLMQFVRSVLYGFTSQRGRYLPPLRGGRPGGSLHVAGPNGSFQISRHQDQEDPDGDDEISLSPSDGTRPKVCSRRSIVGVRGPSGTYPATMSTRVAKIPSLGRCVPLAHIAGRSSTCPSTDPSPAGWTLTPICRTK